MPWGAIAGAIISTIGSIAASHQASETATANNYQSYYYTKKLTDYNNQLARENYDYEYAKESPSARVQQYNQAGLHSGLMHSHGFAGMQGTVSSAPSGTITPSSAGFAPYDFSALAQLASTITNIEKQKSDADYNRMNTLLREAELYEKKAQAEDAKNTVESRKKADYYRRQAELTLQQLEKENKNIDADTELKGVQKEVAEAEKNLKLSQEQESKARTKESQAREVLVREQINTEKAQQILAKASAHELRERAKKYASEIGLNQQQTKQLEELAGKIAEEKRYQQWVNDVIDDTGFDPSKSGVFGTLERQAANVRGKYNVAKGFVLDLLAHPPADINYGN